MENETSRLIQDVQELARQQSQQLELIGTASAIVGLTSVLVGTALIVFSYLREKQPQSAGENTAERVQRLTRTLNEAAQVVDEIEKEIEKRHDLAQELQQDIDQLENLRDLNQQQVEAVVQAIDAPIQRQGRRSLLVNFVFFLLGIVASIISTFIASAVIG